MGFHEVRFPTSISFGSHGGPERKTEIVTLANGFEERNTPWSHSRRRYDAGIGVRSLDELEEVIAFFEARRGQLHGFRWKDWADFKSAAPSKAVGATDQSLGTGDGVNTRFQLAKTYESGGETYTRPICKPVASSLQVAVDGQSRTENNEWTVDLATGLITFLLPPDTGAVVTAGFEFDVPVRFDTDGIRVSAVGFQAGEVPDIPIVEVRV